MATSKVVEIVIFGKISKKNFWKIFDLKISIDYLLIRRFDLNCKNLVANKRIWSQLK